MGLRAVTSPPVVNELLPIEDELVDVDDWAPGLYASAPDPLPFAPSLHIRAFLLRRRQGNLLVYSVGTLAADVRAIGDLGGISRRYMNHRHEAPFACKVVADTFDAPLYCHEHERSSVVGNCNVDRTFSGRHMLGGDFDVIPTPGHTSGATAFLWDSGRHRFLFTGDTIYLHEGEWVAAVLEGSDRGAYMKSLDLIRELDFDVLVPWAATAGQPCYAVTGRDDAQRRIDVIMERLWRGDDH
jgi:hypothetical protein